ncbi:ESX secretion-associated protein EspG [Nocardia elegans]|uniref:ESX secretion-associated protein EspG n=1 Tax=Nocardia elegans TaxID=300029 RepID=UPI001E3115C1|nr:ESX secretion-associated protein EspG [Nocardia elegans]
MDRAGVNWTLAPDEFAAAWARADGDRIPYPLAVRSAAGDAAEHAARQAELARWCDRVVDADMAAALRVLARPTVLVEVYGEHGSGDAGAAGPEPEHWPPAIAPVSDEPAPVAAGETRPVRVLGAASGNVAVVAAQRPGPDATRGGPVRLYVGGPANLAARVVSVLPENRPGTGERLGAPLARVKEDSRDLVTVPVSGPTTPARIRRLLNRPRRGIGQIVVSARRSDRLRPFGVLCWIDVDGDGRYAVRTGTDVHVTPVTAETFAAQLRPMVDAAEQAAARAEQW